MESPGNFFPMVFKAKLLAAPAPELVGIKLFLLFFFFFSPLRKRSVLEWKVKALNPAPGLQRSMSETSTFM